MKSFHVCPEIDLVLRASPAEAGNLFRHVKTGLPVEWSKVKTTAAILQAKAMRVIPV